MASRANATKDKKKNTTSTRRIKNMQPEIITNNTILRATHSLGKSRKLPNPFLLVLSIFLFLKLLLSI